MCVENNIEPDGLRVEELKYFEYLSPLKRDIEVNYKKIETPIKAFRTINDNGPTELDETPRALRDRKKNKIQRKLSIADELTEEDRLDIVGEFSLSFNFTPEAAEKNYLHYRQKIIDRGGDVEDIEDYRIQRGDNVAPFNLNSESGIIRITGRDHLNFLPYKSFSLKDSLDKETPVKKINPDEKDGE